MAEIYFVRHGETDSNIRGLLHGRTDVPLTPLGRRQAGLVARRLAQLNTFQALYTSPLQRAATTAAAIAAELGLRPAIVPDLAEFNFGEFEGITLGELQSRHPDIFRRIGDLNDHDFRFPHGESRREFHQRVRSVVEEVAGRHGSERVVVVAHGGVIGSAVAQLNGGDPNDWERFQVHNCSITHLEFDGHQVRAVHCWNDITHLEPNREVGGDR